MPKPKLEVADVFRKYGRAYRQKHGTSMSQQQRRAMHEIETCRTAALGGHVDQCDACGHQAISYNSCRNRHCPKCQALAKARWLQARQAELLPVEYYHVVFTIPDNQLAPIALQNQRVFYNLMFRLVSETLQTIAADPKHLGASIGFLAVLHTWGQTLTHHPHVHCVVPGGGLSPNGQAWVSCRPGFFLPMAVLSAYFRNHFLKALEKAFNQGCLEFYGTVQHLEDPEAFKKVIETCKAKKWGVMAKPPFGGPAKALDYLGCYVHRIAISNHRLVDMRDGKISFTWRDYKHSSAQKTMTLDAQEFIRRFLQHVLPSGFMRVRHFGLLANCHRTEKLELCRSHLGAPEPPPLERQNWPDLVLSLTGKDPLLCPHCKRGRLVCTSALPPSKPAPLPATRAPP